MMHTNRQGESKILKKCRLPITGVNCVKKIVTNLAVLEVTKNGFKLLERASRSKFGRNNKSHRS